MKKLLALDAFYSPDSLPLEDNVYMRIRVSEDNSVTYGTCYEDDQPENLFDTPEQWADEFGVELTPEELNEIAILRCHLKKMFEV